MDTQSLPSEHERASPVSNPRSPRFGERVTPASPTCQPAPWRHRLQPRAGARAPVLPSAKTARSEAYLGSAFSSRARVGSARNAPVYLTTEALASRTAPCRCLPSRAPGHRSAARRRGGRALQRSARRRRRRRARQSQTGEGWSGSCWESQATAKPRACVRSLAGGQSSLCGGGPRKERRPHAAEWLWEEKPNSGNQIQRRP